MIIILSSEPIMLIIIKVMLPLTAVLQRTAQWEFLGVKARDDRCDFRPNSLVCRRSSRTVKSDGLWAFVSFRADGHAKVSAGHSVYARPHHQVVRGALTGQPTVHYRPHAIFPSPCLPHRWAAGSADTRCSCSTSCSRHPQTPRSRWRRTSCKRVL